MKKFLVLVSLLTVFLVLNACNTKTKVQQPEKIVYNKEMRYVPDIEEFLEAQMEKENPGLDIEVNIDTNLYTK
jgi:hypothetical protein